MVTFLVNYVVNININEGVPKSAPIAQAASEDEFSIVEYLFNRDAILDVSSPNRNPLFSAVYGGHLDGKKPKVDGKTVQGHHSYSASQYPHLANKGEVIYPAAPNEHLNGWHGG